MTPTTSRTLVFAFVVVAFASGGSLAGRTQQPAPAPEVLTALLTEVRGLREAMEQLASAGPRLQLTLGRLQLQEQRITTLVRRLDDVRAGLAQSRKEFVPLDRHVKGLMEGLRQEPNDPDFRRDREDQLKGSKGRNGPDKRRTSTTLNRRDVAGAGHRRRAESLERFQPASRRTGTRVGPTVGECGSVEQRLVCRTSVSSLQDHKMFE